MGIICDKLTCFGNVVDANQYHPINKGLKEILLENSTFQLNVGILHVMDQTQHARVTLVDLKC